jgi:hypothetical protein
MSKKIDRILIYKRTDDEEVDSLSEGPEFTTVITKTKKKELEGVH